MRIQQIVLPSSLYDVLGGARVEPEESSVRKLVIPCLISGEAEGRNDAKPLGKGSFQLTLPRALQGEFAILALL